MEKHKVSKEKFNALEKEIIGVLASAGKPITTYYVAEKANTTRLTAKKVSSKAIERRRCSRQGLCRKRLQEGTLLVVEL
jgi:hypothetical protein